jgi:hypothetical protein
MKTRPWGYSLFSFHLWENVDFNGKFILLLYTSQILSIYISTDLQWSFIIHYICIKILQSHIYYKSYLQVKYIVILYNKYKQFVQKFIKYYLCLGLYESKTHAIDFVFKNQMNLFYYKHCCHYSLLMIYKWLMQLSLDFLLTDLMFNRTVSCWPESYDLWNYWKKVIY